MMIVPLLRKFKSFGEEDTHSFGHELASELKSGSVVSFSGELGVGKTALIRGICECLCPNITISSPSFTLINIYSCNKFNICHIDFYRIDNDKEIEELGLDDFLNGEYIVLIEWGEKIEKYLPPETIRVKITIIGDNLREIEVRK